MIYINIHLCIMYCDDELVMLMSKHNFCSFLFSLLDLALSKYFQKVGHI